MLFKRGDEFEIDYPLQHLGYNWKVQDGAVVKWCRLVQSGFLEMFSDGRCLHIDENVQLSSTLKKLVSCDCFLLMTCDIVMGMKTYLARHLDWTLYHLVSSRHMPTSCQHPSDLFNTSLSCNVFQNAFNKISLLLKTVDWTMPIWKITDRFRISLFSKLFGRCSQILAYLESTGAMPVSRQISLLTEIIIAVWRC